MVAFKIHFSTSDSITARAKKRKKVLCTIYKHLHLKMLLFFVPLFPLYSTYFFILASKQCPGLLKKPKKHLNLALGTAILIKSKTHAYSNEKITFS